MRIYSDVLTRADLNRTIGQVPGMYIEDIEPLSKPKVRQRGWKLSTASSTGNRWKNSGNRGAERIKAATRDDHGMWFAMLYAIDPNARIAEYGDVQEFHKKTENKYR